MKTVALVPIKLNSERLPGKNIKKLNGKPLIHYILQQLTLCKSIDHIYVFCSDTRIIPYIKSFSKVSYLKRSKTLDTSKATINDVLESFVSKVKADVYVLANATAPLLKAQSISKCVDAVISKKYDSAFTAINLHTFAWINGKPNYTLSNAERTQDLPPIVIETCGAWVFRSEVFKKTHGRIGKSPFIYNVSDTEAVDIDELKDFQYAEYLLKTKKC